MKYYIAMLLVLPLIILRFGLRIDEPNLENEVSNQRLTNRARHIRPPKL